MRGTRDAADGRGVDVRGVVVRAPLSRLACEARFSRRRRPRLASEAAKRLGTSALALLVSVLLPLVCGACSGPAGTTAPARYALVADTAAPPAPTPPPPPPRPRPPRH